MNILTDTERLEIAMSLLSERDVDAYEQLCTEAEQKPRTELSGSNFDMPEVENEHIS